MGLFSFGNQEKDAAPARRSRASAGTERRKTTRADGERRSGQASLLDPTLPEKQRARRRLVGAIALVLAAVVVLPMVLDTHPKPASDDIAVNIPRQPKAPAAAHPNAVTQLAPDVTPADTGASATGTPATGTVATVTSSVAPASMAHAESSTADHAREVQTQAQAAMASTATVKPGTKPAAMPASANLVAGANDAGKATGKTTDTSAAAARNHEAAASGSRYVISVGAFTSDSSAHAWLAKLKSVGVPAYLETRRQSDGSTRILLRAGPFDDRAGAEAAVKKVRDAGLSAQSNVASGSASSNTSGSASGHGQE